MNRVEELDWPVTRESCPGVRIFLLPDGAIEVVDGPEVTEWMRRHGRELEIRLENVGVE